MALGEIFTEVPARSSDIIRPIPQGLMSRYFGAIMQAYEMAGLEPGPAVLGGFAPGFEEDGVSFQVGLSSADEDIVRSGWFIAESQDEGAHRPKIIHGVISAYNHELIGERSGGLVVSGEPGSTAEAFKFRSGKNGSVAYVNELVMASQAKFEPVEAKLLLPSLRG